MAAQQVVGPPARAAIFLVLVVEPGKEAQFRGFLTEVSGLVRTVAIRRPEENLACNLGIGAQLWDRTFDLPRPKHLHPFEAIYGEKHTAPATDGDILIHLRCGRMDLAFELARIMTERLAGIAQVVDEVHGFRYLDNRNLLGFVDGTENPEGGDAEVAVTIGDEDPEYAGGSYVIVQRYSHDMSGWAALSVEQQEQAMGRTKLEDIEMSDEVKPTNSHIALNVITDEDGNELEILRENMPFGQVGTGEYGTYFIGYAKDPSITEQMLQNMFIGSPPGNYDRILDFSTAETGSLYFVPSVEFLDDPPAMFSPPATEPQAQPETSTDGSLGIGSLRATPK